MAGLVIVKLAQLPEKATLSSLGASLAFIGPRAGGSPASVV
jgi:hypothetical protein